MNINNRPNKKKSSLWLLVILVLPYIALVGYLGFAGPEKISSLPRLALWGMAGYFLAIIFAFPLLKRKKNPGSGTHSQRSDQPQHDGMLANPRAKRMFILYLLSLIGGIAATILGIIPWLYAIPGIVVVSAMLALYWRLLSDSAKGRNATGS